MIEPKKVTAVLGLAINSAHEFLISQRNQPEHPDIHLCWQLPGGGMEAGETPAETLARELKEELNIIPEIIHPNPITKIQNWTSPHRQYSITLICFLVNIGSQIPQIIDPESLDWKWVIQSDIYRLKSLPLTSEFIDDAAKICNEYSLWPL